MVSLPIDLPAAAAGTPNALRPAGGAPRSPDEEAVHRFAEQMRQENASDQAAFDPGTTANGRGTLPCPSGITPLVTPQENLASPREIADEIAALWLLRNESGDLSEMLVQVDASLLPETFLRVQKDADGRMTVTLHCADDETRAWLQKQLEALAESLEKRLGKGIALRIEPGLAEGVIDDPETPAHEEKAWR